MINCVLILRKKKFMVVYLLRGLKKRAKLVGCR